MDEKLKKNLCRIDSYLVSWRFKILCPIFVGDVAAEEGAEVGGVLFADLASLSALNLFSVKVILVQSQS